MSTPVAGSAKLRVDSEDALVNIAHVALNKCGKQCAWGGTIRTLPDLGAVKVERNLILSNKELTCAYSRIALHWCC